MYSIVEEASEAIVEYCDTLEEAIEDIGTNYKYGKYLILDGEDTIVYDSKPGISYKI